MNATTLEYKKKVWDFLERIEPGRTYTVAKLAKPQNREAFVNAIKEYMESLPYGGWVMFNHNYTKFYKTTAVKLTKMK